MQYVRCPAILVLVALVLCGPGVSSQPDRDQDQYQNQDLELELRHHRLLQRARSAGLLSQVREPTTTQIALFLLKTGLTLVKTLIRRSEETVNVWKFSCFLLV